MSFKGLNRMNCRGSSNNNDRNCRSANRNDNDPGNRNNNAGFRLLNTRRTFFRSFTDGRSVLVVSRCLSCSIWQTGWRMKEPLRLVGLLNGNSEASAVSIVDKRIPTEHVTLYYRAIVFSLFLNPILLTWWKVHIAHTISGRTRSIMTAAYMGYPDVPDMTDKRRPSLLPTERGIA